MAVALRYPELEVRGAPYDMGCQIGEELREHIRGFNAIAIERVNKSVAVLREQALAVAAECLPYVEAYSPPMLEELRGKVETEGEAGLRGHLERRAAGRLDADRGLRAHAVRLEDLPADRSRGPQGRLEADVGGHGPTASG